MKEMTSNKRIEKPEIVQTESVPTATLYAKIPAKEIQSQMGLLLKELSDELRSQGIKPTGPWFTHHLRSPGEFFDFEVCFPVVTPVKANGRVTPGEWPARKMVRTTYHGEYQGLAGGWQDFLTEIQSMGLQVTPEIWEVYLIGPDTTNNPGEWRTQLNRAII
jgi:effector-binding domain-containing protein